MTSNSINHFPIKQGLSVLFQRGTSFTVAVGMTLVLLFLMTQMIQNDMPPLEEEVVHKIINFNLVEEENEVETWKPVVPKVEEQPAITRDTFDPSMSLDDVTAEFLPGNQDVDIDTDVLTGIPGGMAMVPISPSYPDRAAQQGICGHVIVQFDISAAGSPTNVVILESTSRLFNRNAVSAVERARYKPHMEGGKPAAVIGRQEKISFVLEDGC